jgi:beta-lactamase superfamily II metal-dependent hydrolase
MTLGSDDSHAAEENNYSLITTVEFGEIALLLAGDAEQDRLTEFMVVSGEDRTYDLIKIPHHGSYDKALGDLLRGSKGLRYCVVHAGSAAEVEAELVTAMRSVGSAVYYTYDGNIAFATDGQSMVMTQE